MGAMTKLRCGWTCGEERERERRREPKQLAKLYAFMV